jgi:hypothetical protein
MNKRFVKFLEDLAEENQRLEHSLCNERARADELYRGIDEERSKIKLLQAKVRELKRQQKEAE